MGLANAQGDNFFRGGFDSYENRDGDETTGGISNYGIGETVPLGSGMLVLVAAGVGYAVVRRKRSIKKGLTNCKKKVETVHTTDVTPVLLPWMLTTAKSSMLIVLFQMRLAFSKINIYK